MGEKCVVCKKSVYATERLPVEGKVYHKHCFRCSVCNSTLKLGSFAALEGTLYCKPHFKQSFMSAGNYSEGFGKETPKQKWEKAKAGETDEPTDNSAPAAAGGSAAPSGVPAVNGDVFSVNGDRIDSAAAAAVVTNDSVKCVQLNDCTFGGDGMGMLARFISKDGGVVAADLSGNNLSVGGAAEFSTALSNSSLAQLYLADNNIGPRGAPHIAEKLSANTSLQYLDMSSNRLTYSGTMAVAKAAAECVSLSALDLSDNGLSEDQKEEVAALLDGRVQLLLL